MKDRPILFSAPKVRAILDGRKTQTRRVIKSQPSDHHWHCFKDYTLSAKVLPCANNGGTTFVTWTHRARGNFDVDWARPFCPFGQPGDRLWVKETWNTSERLAALKPTEIDPLEAHIFYAADCSADGYEKCKPWRSPLFMRRWMSRIALKIESVRIERLNEISEEDAKAEGASKEFECDIATFVGGGKLNPTFYLGFKHLWESINGPGSWAANPWVWVLTFKRI